MRNTILAAAAAFVIGGVLTGALVADAQPAPPPQAGMMGHPGPDGQAMDGAGEGWRMPPWMHRMHGPRAEQPAPRTFALVYRQPDRALAPADVQKIAEAFLLWNGNHTWKVIDVAATADGPIGFALATPEGSVIARFTMDPHTGRITRTG